MPLAKGESATARYGLFVFTGRINPDEVAALYANFVRA
jgi:hypothetical protein